MYTYTEIHREKYFGYLTEIFALSEKAKVDSNQIISFNENESVSIDILIAHNDVNTFITTNGLSALAASELCVTIANDIINEEKKKLIIEKICDYCSRIARCFVNKHDGTTLTVDFSDVVGVKAFAEVTNEIGVTLFCDGACEWLPMMCWSLR